MREADPASRLLTAAQETAADAGLKAMMPFERPFLDYSLHALADAGIRRAALVVGPEHDEVRAYYSTLRTRRLSIEFVIQQQPLGTADAVTAAEDWTHGESFLVLNADNLYPAEVLAALVSAPGPAVPGFARDALRLPLARLGTFALLEADHRGCLARIVEKPGDAAVVAAGPAALISVNLWRFDDRIFDPCRAAPLSARGERELPQAVGLAASRGVCIEVLAVQGEVLDLSRRADIPIVGRTLAGRTVDL